MTVTERVFADVGALSRAAAEIVASAAAEALAARSRFVLVLAGGSTPRALYELFSREYQDRIDWARTELFFGDERCVPPDHKDSNYAMARQNLIARVPVPARNVHRIEAELGATAGADKYDQLLKTTFPESSPATFDLVLLGMGADGHTLSLFPGQDYSGYAGRWVLPAVAPASYSVRDRVSLTFEAVATARKAVFLVAGADKAPALAAVRRERGSPRAGLPAARVTCRDEVVWLLDEKAAGKA